MEKIDTLNGIVPDMEKPLKIGINILIAVAVLFAVFYFGKKWFDNYKASQFNNVDITKNPKEALAKTYANRIDAAFTWYNDNEKAIYQVGREMKANQIPFAMVAAAYKAGFGKDLAQRMSTELNAEELEKFYKAAGLTA